MIILCVSVICVRGVVKYVCTVLMDILVLYSLVVTLNHGLSTWVQYS